MLENKSNGFRWEIINVYGLVIPADRLGFISDLSYRLLCTEWPFLIGGDFNMYRFPTDKSNDNIELNVMDAFNEFISEFALSDIYRRGGRLTWTNKQENLVQVALDRVLVNHAWEIKYPLSSLQSLLRIGSDHSPLLLNSSDDNMRRSKVFRFETSWLLVPRFKELVISKIPSRGDLYILEFWNNLLGSLRKFLKGWGANLGEKILG